MDIDFCVDSYVKDNEMHSDDGMGEMYHKTGTVSTLKLTGSQLTHYAQTGIKSGPLMNSNMVQYTSEADIEDLLKSGTRYETEIACGTQLNPGGMKAFAAVTISASIDPKKEREKEKEQEHKGNKGMKVDFTFKQIMDNPDLLANFFKESDLI